MRNDKVNPLRVVYYCTAILSLSFFPILILLQLFGREALCQWLDFRLVSLDIFYNCAQSCDLSNNRLPWNYLLIDATPTCGKTRRRVNGVLIRSYCINTWMTNRERRDLEGSETVSSIVEEAAVQFPIIYHGVRRMRKSKIVARSLPASGCRRVCGSWILPTGSS